MSIAWKDHSLQPPQPARLQKLEKENRQNQVAAAAMRGVLGETEITGIKISNVRYTDKGISVDLSDGSTIAVRITAYAPDTE